MTVRKSEILDAAREMFAEQGVNRTTVRQIGARAGILSGSLYHHYGSKLDLVDEILGEFCAEVLADYERMAAGDADAPTRIRELLRYAFSLLDRHAAPLAIMLHDSADLVKEERFAYLVAFNQQIEDHWTAVVRDGVARGELRATVDPEIFYRHARDTMLGARRWYRPGHRLSTAALAHEYADTLLLGVIARDEP
jgi:TetR/AcrR family transcriptional regulator, cholesterol catabolism regulator